MKKLLLSIFTIASVSFSVSSQTVLYNIGEIFTDVENPATSKNDFIVANKSGKVAVENNEKHSDGIIYTKRLKTGGKCSGSSSFENGIPVSCAIGFPVSEDGTIKMVVLAGGTSDVRIIDYTFVSSTGDINTGSTNYITGGIEAEKVTVGDKEYDDIKPFSFDHKGGAGTM